METDDLFATYLAGDLVGAWRSSWSKPNIDDAGRGVSSHVRGGT